MNNLHEIKGSVRLSAIIGQTLKIKPVKQDEYLGLCPFHNEKTPSFRIYDSTGKYWCFGCKAEGDVFDWLLDQRGMDMGDAKRYLGGDNVQMNVAPIAKKEVVPIVQVPTDDDSDTYYGADKDGVIGLHKLFSHGHSMVHYYRNEDGQILNKFARYEVTPFRPKKIFLPATHTKDGWINKAPTEKRTIYGLEKLKHLSGVRIIVSGEKKCDQLQEKLTDNATLSWSGGDSVFDKHDWLPIKDDVIIYWPDNDSTSIEIQHKLAKVCRKLYVIPIPEGMPKGWDCGNAIDVGWGIDEITAMIGTKVLYETPVEIEGPVVIPADVAIEPKYQLPAKLHGLCGQIEEWINSTAYKKQPLLAINAALAFVGALKGQRVCTERNLLTNIYALSLGESGCGKDHPRQCLEVLANEVGLQDAMMAGVPASGTALVKSVKRGGRCLIQMDELGRVIGNINGKNAGGFQREIVDNMMMLYSSASTLFREKEYAAGREDQEKNAIIKPCLCIHAMTVPERFYNNLTTDDVIDGFLSRWMMVASDNPDPDESEVDTDIDDVPQSIIDKVLEIQEMSTNVKISELPTTNQQIEKIQNAINPKIIPLTPEAKTILTDYKNIARKLKNDLRVAGSPLNALWVRMGENSHKIALIVQEGDYITAQDMQWACDWVMYWTQYSIDQVKEKLSDNEHESIAKKVLAIIRSHKGITRGELTRRTQWLRDTRHRKDILDTLIASDQIETITQPSTDKNQKPVDKFYIK